MQTHAMTLPYPDGTNALSAEVECTISTGTIAWKFVAGALFTRYERKPFFPIDRREKRARYSESRASGGRLSKRYG
jgi:hypothetical protein